MTVGVVVFPGSNCDHDVEHVYGRLMSQPVRKIWHTDNDLSGIDLVVLPGGFAYGDYLRTGALAKLSPVMERVVEFAKRGGPVVGICNGFQILCEAGLLPGVLLQNRHLRFVSKFVNMRVENTDTAFTKRYSKGAVITCPVAHMEGAYFADSETLTRLEGEGQVVFRYCDTKGEVLESANPNGALNNIAGICNKNRNIVGLMPHPERSAEALVGSVGADTGLAMFA